jgi:DNA-cytosine methyltransferase
MRILDVCGGVGGFSLAAGWLGHECVGYYEINKQCVSVYNRNFGTSHVATDIKSVNPADVPDHDILCAGIPCFAKGTLILTYEGYKPIESITTGELVLSHAGTWRKVTSTMSRHSDETIRINGHGTHNLITTPEHPFYIRSQTNKWNNIDRLYSRQLSKPKWQPASTLTKKDRIGMVTPPDYKDRHPESFWWLIGRYLADGWRVKRLNRPEGNGKVVIACGKHKFNSTKTNIEKVFHATIVEERTSFKFHITNNKLYRFIGQFGDGAINKHIPGKYLGLTKSKLAAIIEGYKSGDGCTDKIGWKATTISERLVYSLSTAFQRCTGRSASLHFFKRPPTCIIEGRTCNQHHTYTIQFPNHNRSAIKSGRYNWRLIKSIEPRPGTTVHNLSVEGDESYTANNCVVHNCQSFSLAGKRKGFLDPRGTIINDVLQIIAAKKPRYVLIENVKGLLSSHGGWDFARILSALDEIGYDVEWCILNASDLVPQNRERIFIVGHLRIEPRPQVFPIGQGCGGPAQAPPQAPGAGPRLRGGVASCLAQRDYKGGNNIIVHSTYPRTGDPTQGGTGHLSKADGLAYCCDTHNSQAIEVLPTLTPGRAEKRQNGRRFKEDGDPSFTITAQDIHGVCINKSQIRRLTPTECERLQGFPDGWTSTFQDGKPVSDSQRYRMMGNAVVPCVVQAVMEKLV